MKFKQIFKKIPSQFIHQINRLKRRCLENNVIFTPPKITDSVDEIKTNIQVMNRAIKTSKQRRRREEMSEDQRADLINDDVIRRKKRHAKESPATRQQRLKRNAAMQMQRTEQDFQSECIMQGVEYVPPQDRYGYKFPEPVPIKRARRKAMRNRFRLRAMSW